MPRHCPGLGVVAAVLGVVITMQAIGGSPETVRLEVAATLVGTLPAAERWDKRGTHRPPYYHGIDGHSDAYRIPQ
ncbi:MAG TPA: hypothetical protein VKB88_22505 [Bryobacteraceae bacterium]|nr:hypothetical protein [Bryobacteraceae bacterium]